MPRVMIAASGSGAGKTIFTCGLLSLLKEKGLSVCGFKCGPDYIDPLFHERISGVACENLDPFFSGQNEMTETLSEAGESVCVLEGAMGIYDGITGGGSDPATNGSCYAVACGIETPILLLVDAKGVGRTVLSTLKGILIDDEKHRIAGIVFNRMSASFYETIRDDAEALIRQSGSNAVLLGHIENDKRIHLKSRHLGLMLPDEIGDLRAQVSRFAELIGAGVDVKRLRALMEEAKPLGRKGRRGNGGAVGNADSDPVKDAVRADAGSDVNCGNMTTKSPSDSVPILAVARDEAFCFYYHKNIKLLESLGVKIAYFSPLHDAHLPESISGLLLGGGYPEAHAKALSENVTMRNDIRRALENGLPSLAECGGFLYLHERLEDEDGHAYPMVGVVSGGCRYIGKLRRFGYVTIEKAPDDEGLSDGENWLKSTGYTPMLLNKSWRIRGHEFHYYESDNDGDGCVLTKPGTGKSWRTQHFGKNYLWGFAHLYYPSCPAFAAAFVERMRAYQRKPVGNCGASECDGEGEKRAFGARYFENRDCEYYPCHKGIENINCLFCYCPFYWFSDCPGKPRFKEKGAVKIKDCSGCVYPHVAEHYGEIKEEISRRIYEG